MDSRWLVVGLCAGWSAVANAQPAGESAEALFQRGKQLMSEGKTAEACAAFDESQKKVPALATVMNQANCREQNGQLATAYHLFREAARQAGSSSDPSRKQLQDVAKDRADKLQPRLSTLRIVVTETSRLDKLEILRDGEPVEPGVWNQTQPIDGGKYAITARAPEHDEWTGSVVIGVSGDAQRVEIPRLDASIDGTPQPEGPLPEPSMWTAPRKVAIVLGGAALVGVGVGIAFGASADGKVSEAQALCRDPDVACSDAQAANTLLEDARSQARTANITMGVSAGVAVLAGVLWFIGSPERPSRVSVVPRTTTDGAGLVLVGSF